jgi:hypothetical protein
MSMEANPLNSSALIFPVLECVHIAGFALSAGTIAIVDFRLLGFGMKNQTAAAIAADTGLWTLTGLVLMVFSGLMLFSSDPDMYYLNIPFDLKMVFLVLAILFHYTIHRGVVSSVASSGSSAGKLVGLISIALWTCVIFGGIFIGFVNSTLDINRV